MKKLIAGIALMACGVLTVGFILIAGSVLVESVHEWDTAMGRFWYGIYSNGLMFLAVTGFIAAGFGLVLTLFAAFSKKD